MESKNSLILMTQKHCDFKKNNKISRRITKCKVIANAEAEVTLNFYYRVENQAITPSVELLRGKLRPLRLEVAPPAGLEPATG